MNNYFYYIDGEKFTTDIFDKIPRNNISSPNENIPAIEDTLTGEKLWCNEKDFWHRLTGPAYICPDRNEFFYLNGQFYENIHDWLKDHPSPDLYFNAIGIFTETERVLWFLQN
jgi:hypothetical protein